MYLSDYSFADIERFIELSIRRGSPLKSLSLRRADDLRVVVGAALLALDSHQGALTEELIDNALSVFLTREGDWLDATPEELRLAAFSLGYLQKDEMTQEIVCHLRTLPRVSRSRLIDEMEAAQAILNDRRARTRETLQAKNREINREMIESDPALDERYMRKALELAREARDAGEIPVGALVVQDDQIVALGSNRTLRDKDPTAHAEVVAIRAASKALGNHRLTHATLYVTLEPCPMCAGAIKEARLKRVVFAACDVRQGAMGEGFNLFTIPGMNHHPFVARGVLEQEARTMLTTFFKARRQTGINEEDNAS